MDPNRFRGPMLGIVGLFCLLMPGCGDEPSEPQESAQTPQPPVIAQSDRTDHEPASTEGVHLQVVELDDIKNLIAETAAQDRVLVIDFWATWCVPCVEMFPSLHAGLVARGAHRPEGPVRAVSVTLDDPSREAQAVAFLAEHDAIHDAYIVKNDSQAQQALSDGLGEKWNSLVVPAILVYDPRGRLAGEFLEGGSTDAILDRVDRLLASGQENKP